MQDLQAVLDDGVATGDAPFLVAMVTDRSGIRFAGAAGDRAPGRPADTASMMRLFSMTKAVGATAAMILVDRGRLALDTPVETLLPEFARLQVFEGFDGDTAVLRPPSSKATVRQLLTHTAGLEYDTWNGEMAAYMAATGHPSLLTGSRATLFAPLMRDPGTRWAYGPGADWIGQVVEAIDGRSIVDFCAAEIFGPLGMTDTRFELPDVDRARLSTPYLRQTDGAFAPLDLAPPANPEFYGMGHALWGTAPDYLRLLQMFLGRGTLDGAQILSPATVDAMLANQTHDLSIPTMVSTSPLSADVDLLPGARLSHSLGFLRNEDDILHRRAAGSQSWAGILNTHYWFDPRRGIAAVFMSQLLPFADQRFMRRYREFEAAVYRVIG